MLVINPNFVTTNTVQVVSGSNIPFDLKSQIKEKIQSVIEKDKMAEVIKQTAIPDLEKRIEATHTRINIETIKMGMAELPRKVPPKSGWSLAISLVL